jgi:hypothetical protein
MIIFFVIFLYYGIYSQESNGIEDTIELKAQLLTEYYKQAIQYPDSCEIQRKFFSVFPESFKELQSLYGYDEEPAILYDSNYEHIENLFNKLICISKEEYYLKLIRIGIGGHWDADAVFWFQNQLRNKVLEDPRFTTEILREFQDNEIESFFYFFFSDIHPKWEIIPNELQVIQNYDKHIFDLMKEGFEKAIEDSGH